MKKRIIFLLVWILVLGMAPVPGSAQLTSKQIDLLVEDAMERFTVAGVAVGVVKDGKIVHARGYGVKSVETGEKVDAHTSFAIASNSKAFTTTALALLVEEGILSWTDRVVDHIPEFRMYDEYVTQHFNIIDLVTHRSGLGLGAGDLQFWPDGSDFSMADLLVNFQHFEPVSAFRTQYDYDNILYMVAGEVIRRVSGQSWEDFVKERILVPLGMDHSSTMPASLSGLGNLATPHLAQDGVLKTLPWFEHDPELMNGALGAVLSNAEDMCRWMLVHLNGGYYGENLGKQLFSEESQQEMWRVHTPMDVTPDPRYHRHFKGYGLGWRLQDMNGKLAVYHSGDLTGMLSKTLLLPDLDLGVVVLTNSYYGGEGLFEAVSRTIVDAYLDLEPFDWTSYYVEQDRIAADRARSVVDRVWETVEKGDHPAIAYENYLGTYRDPWFGSVKITLKDGQPWFRSLRSPKLTGPMFHYRANAFAIRWEIRELDADAFAIFSLDEEGKSQTMTMKGISPDIDFSYDFQDLCFERVSGQ
jgi:CubicO group peptidase (beta-lactamase class C family)